MLFGMTVLCTLMFSSCPNSGKPVAPATEPKKEAVLTLEDGTSSIGIMAVSRDDKPIGVEGCNETSIPTGKEMTLNTKDKKIILKGDIIKLECNYNKLTSLDVDVKKFSNVRELHFHKNKLDKDAFEKIFNALPKGTSHYAHGECILYSEVPANGSNEQAEENYKDFTLEELKVIRDKKWVPYKKLNSYQEEKI